MSVWHEQTLNDTARNIPTFSDVFRNRSRAAAEAAANEARVVAELRALYSSANVPASTDRPFIYEADLVVPVSVPSVRPRASLSSVFSSVASRLRRRQHSAAPP